MCGFSDRWTSIWTPAIIDFCHMITKMWLCSINNFHCRPMILCSNCFLPKSTFPETHTNRLLLRLHSSVGRVWLPVWYRYRGGHGFESHWSLRILGGSICNCFSYFISARITFTCYNNYNNNNNYITLFYVMPLFQRKSCWKVFHIRISFIHMQILFCFHVNGTNIFLWKTLHLASVFKQEAKDNLEMDYCIACPDL